ncbi:MAG: hypothetical protein ACOVQ4_08045 [Flectobacillus sp.]|uniref:hypothetical protein n=1 Tax=Flectobacillus sp. TaxID=50419 RepID=UPI003B9C3153
MKNLFFSFIALITLLTSCKSNDNPTPTKTRAEYISAKVWIIDNLTVNGIITLYQKGNTQNLYDLSKVSFNLNSNGTVTGTDNNGSSITGGTWAFNSDQSKVVLTNVTIQGGLALSGEFTIIQLNDTNFDIQGNVTYMGQTGNAVVKMTAK